MKDTEETDASEGVFPSDHEELQHFIELRTAQRSVLLISSECWEFFYLHDIMMSIISDTTNIKLYRWISVTLIIKKKSCKVASYFPKSINKSILNFKQMFNMSMFRMGSWGFLFYSIWYLPGFIRSKSVELNRVTFGQTGSPAACKFLLSNSEALTWANLRV